MSRMYCRIIAQTVRNNGRTSQCCNFSTSYNSGDRKLEYDIVVVGGGIVGVSSARELKMRHPNLRMAVLEKEHRLAFHQSGRSSGVLHAGIYYTPGSLKAKLCVEGMQMMFEYCNKKNIPYKKVGKLIVATNQLELERLYDLEKRAIANKVRDMKVLDGKQIQEVEPHCKGLRAIWSPHTSIIDFAMVTNSYAEDFKQYGGDIHVNYEVNKFLQGDDPNYPVVIKSKDGKSVKTKYVLTCSGLYSDKVAVMSGCSAYPKIVPFRGEYLVLDKAKCNMVKGNIYPVPDPRFPFLGVHFTPRMDGSVWLGPNAVLAFKREGYKYSDISVSELMDALMYPGFIKLSMKYLSAGLGELRKSFFIRQQVKELQKFIPEITAKDVSHGPSGVRAQALDVNGNLVDDFFFDMGTGPIGQRVLHCRNAPSPGATSSLAIAKMMADKLLMLK